MIVRDESEGLDELHRFMGGRVREARRRKRLSQQELSERAGIHRSYLIKIEQGLGNPSGDVLWLLARGCDVDVAYFFPPPPSDSRPS